MHLMGSEKKFKHLPMYWSLLNCQRSIFLTVPLFFPSARTPLRRRGFHRAVPNANKTIVRIPLSVGIHTLLASLLWWLMGEFAIREFIDLFSENFAGFYRAFSDERKSDDVRVSVNLNCFMKCFSDSSRWLRTRCWWIIELNCWKSVILKQQIIIENLLRQYSHRTMRQTLMWHTKS